MKLRATPYAYRHPDHRTEDEPGEAVNAQGSDVAIRGKREEPERSNEERSSLSTQQKVRPQTSRRSEQEAEGAPPPDRITLTIGFPRLERSIDARYDAMLAAGISSRRAVLAIGRRAIGMWIENPDAIGIVDLEGAPVRRGTIETSVTLDRSTFVSIKRRFDPFDIHSDRRIGRAIGAAVIDLWRMSEPKT